VTFPSLYAVRFRHELSPEYLALEITAPCLNDDIRLVETDGLRAYDAVQLAAALELNSRWLTAREVSRSSQPIRTLSTAATAEGLLVEDPNLRR
jgi:uncharacterized protein